MTPFWKGRELHTLVRLVLGWGTLSLVLLSGLALALVVAGLILRAAPEGAMSAGGGGGMGAAAPFPGSVPVPSLTYDAGSGVVVISGGRGTVVPLDASFEGGFGGKTYHGVDGGGVIIDGTAVYQPKCDGGYQSLVRTDAGWHCGNPGQVFTLEQFGAIGNGTTDDSAAMADAISACSANGGQINLGPHTYLVTTGTPYAIGSNCAVVGQGDVSVLYSTAARTTLMTAVSGHNIQVRDLQILGNDNSGNWQVGFANGNIGCTGVDAAQYVIVDNVTFSHLGFRGMQTQCGDYTTPTNTYSNLRFFHCGVGFGGTIASGDPGCALAVNSEYDSYVNVVGNANYVGIIEYAGNLTVTGGGLGQSTLAGIFVENGANDSHSVFADMMINHNAINVWVNDIANGVVFSGDKFFSGDIVLAGPNGAVFSSDQIDVVNLRFAFGTRAVFDNCQWPMGLANTISNNYGDAGIKPDAGASNVVFEPNNFTQDGGLPSAIVAGADNHAWPFQVTGQVVFPKGITETISQAAAPYNVAPVDLSITPQPPYPDGGTATTNTPAGLAIRLAAAGSVGTAGHDPRVYAQEGSTTFFQVANYANGAATCLQIGPGNAYTIPPTTADCSLQGAGSSTILNGLTGWQLDYSDSQQFISDGASAVKAVTGINVGVGNTTTSYGTSAAGVLSLSTGTCPSSGISAGHETLCGNTYGTKIISASGDTDVVSPVTTVSGTNYSSLAFGRGMRCEFTTIGSAGGSCLIPIPTQATYGSILTFDLKVEGKCVAAAGGTGCTVGSGSTAPDGWSFSGVGQTGKFSPNGTFATFATSPSAPSITSYDVSQATDQVNVSVPSANNVEISITSSNGTLAWLIDVTQLEVH